MIKLFAIWNTIVTVSLVAVLFALLSNHQDVKAADATDTVRTSRLEIIDRSGKTKAVLGVDQEGANPKLVLYSNDGREAAFLTLNSNGYGTLYFQNKQTEGKVSVGYLWGSDTLGIKQAEDPLSSWGIRVRGLNGSQTNFGLLNNGQPIPRTR
jgi:hypothetical protein